MMATAKLFQLASALLSRTLDGKVSWEYTAQTDTYFTAFSKYTISANIETSGGYNSDEPFLHIKNADGQLVDIVDVDALVKEGRDKSTAYKLLENIHTAARRSAMGAEEAIDALLGVLVDPKDPKEPKDPKDPWDPKP